MCTHSLSPRYSTRLCWAGLCTILFFFFDKTPHAAEPTPIPVLNEVVAQVGTKSISNRDVETRMELILVKLDAFKKKRMALGTWDDDAQAEYKRLYGPAFKEELRILIKEQLMIQEFIDSKYEFDRRECDRRVRETLTDIQAGQPLQEAQRGNLEAQIRREVSDRMMIEEVRARFLGGYAVPNNRDVRAHYEKHPEEFRYKPGEKIRRVRLLRFYKDYLGLERGVPDALQQIEALREQASAENMADLVRDNSQDEPAILKQGGVLGDPQQGNFIETESLPAAIVEALRGLKPGEISPVFKPDERSWAFVQWVAHRDSGIRPLDEPLIEHIRKMLGEKQRVRLENEWLAKMMRVKAVTDAQGKPILIDFLIQER